MKKELLQLDILNCTIRTCIAMYEATRDNSLLLKYQESGDPHDLKLYNKSGDNKYIEAANLSRDKFFEVNRIAMADNDLTVFIKQQ